MDEFEMTDEEIREKLSLPCPRKHQLDDEQLRILKLGQELLLDAQR